MNDSGPPEPGACAALPLRHEAVASVEAQIAERIVGSGGSVVEPRFPYRGNALLASSIFPIEDVRARRAAAHLINGPSDFARVEPFRYQLEMIEVDWASESMVVILGWPDQFLYRFAALGDSLTVHVGRMLPCEGGGEVRLWSEGQVVVAVTPKARTVGFESYDAEYRLPALPAESGACQRTAPSPVPGLGGARPSVLRDGAGYRMWYGGFSGATGTLFDAVSPDGLTWDAGWSDAHQVRFAEGTPVEHHVYEPDVRIEAGTFVLHANVDERDLRTGVERSFIGGATSEDGLNYSALVEILGPGMEGAWDEDRVDGPSAVVRGGRIYLYYHGADRLGVTVGIGLAVSDDGGATFERASDAPVLGAGDAGSFAELGVLSPSVVHDGERFVMLYTAVSGGGSAAHPQNAVIGWATSSDGIAWTRGAAPLLVPASDWEAGGLSAPSVLLADDGSLDVWYTGSNTRAEPTVGRARCEGSLATTFTTGTTAN